MIHFESLWYFVLLAVVAGLWGLHLWASVANARARSLFGESYLWERLAPNFSPERSRLKFVLLSVALALMVIGIANLRKSSRTEMVQRKGVDVLIALDVSRSMWAQDVKPSRFDRAQQFALKFIESLYGDRVGLIFFAGQSYLQMPMTVDYSAAKLFVRTASPKIDILQGTAMEEAIGLAARLGEQDQKKKQRALVFITDGENHEATVAAKAAEARKQGIATFVVVVGSEQGAPIPLPDGNFQTDKQGQQVVSRMNRTLMEEIASNGGGTLIDLMDNGTDGTISQLRNRMSRLDREAFEQQTFDKFEPYFYWFALPALLLIIIEFLIPYRK